MRFTPDNQYIMDKWLAARGSADMPRISKSTFARDSRISENICLQILAPDDTVRFIYAGSTIQKTLGADPTGKEVANSFGNNERKEVRDLQRARFVQPIIILSHSNTMTAAGDMVQVEILNLPFIDQATDEMTYLIGAFEWTHADTPAKLANGLQSRSLLSRTIFDLKTLKRIDSEFTYPPIAGLKKPKPKIEKPKIDTPKINTPNIDTVELI